MHFCSIILAFSMAAPNLPSRPEGRARWGYTPFQDPRPLQLAVMLVCWRQRANITGPGTPLLHIIACVLRPNDTCRSVRQPGTEQHHTTLTKMAYRNAGQEVCLQGSKQNKPLTLLRRRMVQKNDLTEARSRDLSCVRRV